MGKSLPEGYPSHPPPLARRLDLATLTCGENAKLSRQDANPGRPNETPVWERGRGEFCVFQITQQRSNILFQDASFTRRCVFLFFSLLQWQIVLISFLRARRGKTALYIYSEGRAYKRAQKLVASPQSAALHSTGNISAEDSVHKNKVGHNSTRGIVSLLLFFPLKLLLHKVYISNILCCWDC